MITAPQIALTAIGLAPEGSRTCAADGAGVPCSVCGAPIHAGDPVDPLSFPASFTNRASLAVPGGAWRCGACTAIMSRGIFQLGAANVLIHASGIYPILKREHRAWAFLEPPEPPFAICLQDAKQQHVVWRAPVTLSRDFLMLRLGEKVFRLRRQHLLDAREEAIRLNSLRTAPGRPPNAIADSPFFIHWKMQNTSSGRFKSWFWDLVQQGKVQLSDVPALCSLTGPEIWALNAVLSDTVQRPTPIPHNEF